MRNTVVVAGILTTLIIAGLAITLIGGVTAQPQPDDAPTDNATATANTSSFGAEVSSFMQASTAEAEGELDEHMFGAAISRADTQEERRALIDSRHQELQQRHAELTHQRSAISHDAPGVRDYAIATRVSVGANQLEHSINGTEQAAEQAGLDTDDLNELRTNASEMRGQDVAALARGLTAGPNSGDDHSAADRRGPPDDRPQGDSTNESNTGPQSSQHNPGSNESNSAPANNRSQIPGYPDE